jgi:hypothetical protein
MSIETPQGQSAPDEEWSIKELWDKYEAIAMHFNDLLIRLRTQALAGVAALSAIAGIFGKSGAEVQTSWKMAAGIFFLLCLLWIAIWIIDFCYYNRLLVGAVTALLEIEGLSKTMSRVRHINISTTIEQAVRGRLPRQEGKVALSFGRWAFYVIVFFALLCGLGLSFHEYWTAAK